MHHASCIMHHASCIMHRYHASCPAAYDSAVRHRHHHAGYLGGCQQGDLHALRVSFAVPPPCSGCRRDLGASFGQRTHAHTAARMQLVLHPKRPSPCTRGDSITLPADPRCCTTSPPLCQPSHRGRLAHRPWHAAVQSCSRPLHTQLHCLRCVPSILHSPPQHNTSVRVASGHPPSSA